jgi:hypothetical protein
MPLISSAGKKHWEQQNVSKMNFKQHKRRMELENVNLPLLDPSFGGSHWVKLL